MRQRRTTVKKIKYAEDELSDGEKEEYVEKRKKARQLEYQTRQVCTHFLFPISRNLRLQRVGYWVSALRSNSWSSNQQTQRPCGVFM